MAPFVTSCFSKGCESEFDNLQSYSSFLLSILLIMSFNALSFSYLDRIDDPRAFCH
jgi:hypothetical protein